VCHGYTSAPISLPFVNACTLTGATTLAFPGIDDATVPITLPFTFDIYTQMATTAWASTNGIFGFGAANSAYSNTCAPAMTGGGPHLYVFWDDLYNNQPGGAACVATVGTAPDRQFVISWINWTHYSGATGDLLNFSVVLSETTGTIDYIYGPMTGPNSDGNSATIAIDDGGSNVTSIGCNTAGTIMQNTAIRFTPM
jgi:hypothetical protein